VIRWVSLGRPLICVLAGLGGCLWVIAVVSASIDFASRHGETANPVMEWRKIRVWTGSGNQETEPFATEGQEWRVVWKFDNGQLPADGLLQIYAHEAESRHVVSLAANVVAVKQSDVAYVRTPPGRYFLRINAIGNWSVTAEDRPAGTSGGTSWQRRGNPETGFSGHEAGRDQDVAGGQRGL
jgi:hypothetical protein